MMSGHFYYGIAIWDGGYERNWSRSLDSVRYHLGRAAIGHPDAVISIVGLRVSR